MKRSGIKKPDKKVLAACYARVVSAVVEDRVSALFAATQWWEQAALSFIAQARLTTDQRTAFDRAAKARKLAAGSTIVGEQEQALRTACRLYEKIWGASQSLASIDDAYKAYEEQRPALEALVQKRQADRQQLLDFLGRVFHPMTFGIAALADNKPQMISEGQLVLNHSFADDLSKRYAKGAAINIFLEELVPVLKALSLTSNNGVLQIDAVKALNAMLPQVVTQAVAELGKQVTVKATRSAAGPKSAKAGYGSAKDFLFRPGTANEALYNFLRDKQPHTVAECLSVASAAGATKRPQDTLTFIVWKGKQTGKYTVTKSKGIVQMTF